MHYIAIVYVQQVAAGSQCADVHCSGAQALNAAANPSVHIQQHNLAWFLQWFVECDGQLIGCRVGIYAGPTGCFAPLTDNACAKVL